MTPPIIGTTTIRPFYIKIFYLLLLCSSSCHAWTSSFQHGRSLSFFRLPAAADDSKQVVAHRIMWNQHSRKRQSMQYRIIAAEACEGMAREMQEAYPDRFTYHPTVWEKFPDGTDNIEIGGFLPYNLLSGEHVLFLASFHNNDVTLSQFQVIICLLQSFIESLTVVLPYYPVGTMERVTKEGTVATAATYAHMFSSLPSCGRPTRLMVYDLHTLQNRFYLVCYVDYLVERMLTWIASLSSNSFLVVTARQRCGISAECHSSSQTTHSVLQD